MIGPAFLNGDLFKVGFWVYYTAPFAGGMVAGVLYDHLYLKNQDEMDEVEKELNRELKNGREVIRRDIELSFTQKEEIGDDESEGLGY